MAQTSEVAWISEVYLSQDVRPIASGKGIFTAETRAEDGETIYRFRLARTRELKARPDIWKALDDRSK